jgi:Na+-transporting methylmalonyl-CoA/oxaloacetate decarboxylase gamma subunit
MNTDLTQLFKTITESVPHYLMFMGLVFLVYSLTIAFIKVLSDNVVKVVLAARAPVAFKIKDNSDLENS